MKGKESPADMRSMIRRSVPSKRALLYILSLVLLVYGIVQIMESQIGYLAVRRLSNTSSISDAAFLKITAGLAGRPGSDTLSALRGQPRQICNCDTTKDMFSVRKKSGRRHSQGKIMTSTCSKEASEHGTGQKVISYSLYINEKDDIPFFFEGIKPNLKQLAKLFPGWVARIYTNVPSGNPYSCELICLYDFLFWCDITDIPGMGDMSELNGRAWRFLPIGDPTVDLVLSRDLDGSLTKRERVAVAEWERSDQTFHVIRDHYFHNTEILGGLWGAKNGRLGPEASRSLQQKLIKGARKKSVKFWDQELVKLNIYEPFKGVTLAHDSYFCGIFPDGVTVPFSTKRIGQDFVGLDGRKNEDRWIKPCPEECRPAYGKDWTYC